MIDNRYQIDIPIEIAIQIDRLQIDSQKDRQIDREKFIYRLQMIDKQKCRKIVRQMQINWYIEIDIYRL